MPRPDELFLSHSSEDRGFVTDLVAALQRHRVPVWYSRTDIVGAQQWHDEIGQALQRCDWFALVLSPNAVTSAWVKRELLFSLRQRRLENHILPVLYQSCDYETLSWTLPDFQAVDFRAGFDEGCKALLRVWGVGYRPP